MKEALQGRAGPMIVGVLVAAALALTCLGVYGLRLWSIRGRDHPSVDRQRACRRGLTGLVLGTVCFMAVADIAFLGLWTLLGGSF